MLKERSAAAEQSYQGPAGTNRVLVVDDEEVMAILLRDVLGEEFSLATVQAAEDAIPYLVRNPPDVLLVDKNLPGMSGLELLEQAKALHPEVEVIVITGYASLESAVEALRLGAYDYLIKPFDDIAIVLEKVRLAAEKKELTSERRQLMEQVLAANEEAKKEGLAVCVGLNMRHTQGFREVADRVRDGALGRLLYLRCYCNNAGVWVRRREADQTEMEYQMRNWYYFNWLSGDHIVEQHVHLLDLVNWMKGDYPVEANGMGGRQVRKGKDHGEIYDHHAVEYTYADGTKTFSFCRHIPGCWNHGGGYAHGSEGTANAGGGEMSIQLKGKELLSFEHGEDGHQVEHDDLFAALLAGQPLNEGDYGARSTMTAILGRMATYSGKVVRWDEAFNSQMDISPQSYAWDADPPVLPAADGFYPCPIPGVTKAW